MSMQDQYLEFRNMTPEAYKDTPLPYYYLLTIPAGKNIRILDIGCGFGQILLKLKALGYTNLKGIDISNTGKDMLLAEKIEFEQINDIKEYCLKTREKYDFIIMSHVLEHLEKKEIISSLISIKEIMADKGKFLIVVPNAQSSTNAYWAYEDFTHNLLFTSGSIFYVLKMAGFNKISFIDPKGIEGLKGIKKYIRVFFLALYNYNKKFWNRITASLYHEHSPNIYSFDIKVIAEKE